MYRTRYLNVIICTLETIRSIDHKNIFIIDCVSGFTTLCSSNFRVQQRKILKSFFFLISASTFTVSRFQLAQNCFFFYSSVAL